MKSYKNLLILMLASGIVTACDRIPNSTNLSISSDSGGSNSAQRAGEDSLKKDHKEQTQIAEKIDEKLENLGVKEDQLGLKDTAASGSVKGTEATTSNQQQQLNSDIEKKMDAKLEQLDASGNPIPAESSASASPVKGSTLDAAPQKENKTNQEIEQKMDAKEEPLKGTQPQPTPSAS